MTNNHRKILAIDPGTRVIGVALLESDKIIYHDVKMIPKRQSPQEALREGQKIIARLIKDFRPQILAVEKTYFANDRNGELLNTFTTEIGALGRRKGLSVVTYAPNTVRKFVCGNGRAGKEEVARAVALRYPELKVYLTQDRKWKATYHRNRFDAIALGMMVAQL
ncbi:MAG: crossover junction endodeoxyribonuclease RuvC [Candidatus Paceibacterota bacterium]|jgi:crossover junction endodeoxyribonuclease RuvC